MRDALRRHRGTAALVAAWVAACCLWLSPRLLIPDGAGYWSWLPSVVLSGDLVLFDEWQELGMAPGGRFMHQWVTPTLHLANHWGPGSAMAWAPGFLTGELAAHLPPLASFPRDGFRLPHVAGGAVVDALVALLAVLLGRRTARRVAPGREATLAAWGILFGSPLLFYGLRGGFMAHSIGALASVLVLSLALRLRDGVDVERMLACGLACGFAFAVRPQLLALSALPVVLVPFRAWRAAPRAAAALGAGIALGALPQLIVSQVLYGCVLGAMAGGPGPAGTPYAAFERFWTWEPYLSAWHGLVPWTPFLVLGFAGLCLLARRDPRLGAACAVVVASQAFAVATLDRPFWGAHAFGQRRLDGLTGLLLLGAAVALARMPRRLGVTLTVACCAWTTSLFLASWSRIPLNEPIGWPGLARAATAAVLDVGAWARPLAPLPPAVRVAASVALLASALPLAALVVLVARSRPRARLALGAAWLAACSAWTLASAARSSERLGPWREIAERNLRLGELSGAIDSRIGMLRLEARWYRERGDAEEAARVDARADALQAALEAAMARAGFEPPPEPGG